jgi:hypothetical protein
MQLVWRINFELNRAAVAGTFMDFVLCHGETLLRVAYKMTS